MNVQLFQLGNFTLHSGSHSKVKICCEALTQEDWEAIAVFALDYVGPFGSVEGITRGGLPLARALKQYCTTGPLLIVDDVCTTGNSFEEYRKQRGLENAIGLAFICRGQCPDWVVPLLRTPPSRVQ